MQLYKFEVLNGEELIAVQPAVPLRDTRAAWPKIAKIARKISLPGCRIRVRDQSGEIVILIGAAVAQLYPLPQHVRMRLPQLPWDRHALTASRADGATR